MRARGDGAESAGMKSFWEMLETRLFRRCTNLVLRWPNLGRKAGWTGFVAISLGACSDGWREEVLLHDDRKLIVNRTVLRGDWHETGQRPPIRVPRLGFFMPGTRHRVTWEHNDGEALRAASFLPMQLELFDVQPYFVALPMGCLSYNNRGRANSPYVVFTCDGKRGWHGIGWFDDKPTGNPKRSSCVNDGKQN